METDGRRGDGRGGVLCAVVGVHVQIRRATSWQADRGSDKLRAARRRDEEEAQRGRRGEGGMRRTGSGTMFRKKAVTRALKRLVARASGRLSSIWWLWPCACSEIMNFKNIPSGVGQQPDALWLTRTIRTRTHV